MQLLNKRASSTSSGRGGALKSPFFTTPQRPSAPGHRALFAVSPNKGNSDDTLRSGPPSMDESFLLPKPTQPPALNLDNLTTSSLDFVTPGASSLPSLSSSFDDPSPFVDIVLSLRDHIKLDKADDDKAMSFARQNLLQEARLLLDPLKSSRGPALFAQAGGLSALGLYLRSTAVTDQYERALSAEILCECLSNTGLVHQAPDDAQSSLPSRDIHLTTADLRLIVNSLACCFSRPPTVPPAPSSLMQDGNAKPSRATDVLAQRLRDTAQLTRLGFEDEEPIQVGTACLALHCLPPSPYSRSYMALSPSEEHAEVFFAATALGRLAALQFQASCTPEIADVFAQARVISRLSALTHSSDPHLCFASCFALRQILALQPVTPQAAAARAATGAGRDQLAKAAVDAGVVNRILGLLIGRLDDRRKSLAERTFEDDDDSDFVFVDAASTSNGIVRLSLSILDSVCDSPPCCQAFVDSRGLDCLMLLAALARDIKDDDAGAATLKLAKKIGASDPGLLASVVKAGGVSVALSFLDDGGADCDPRARGWVGRASRVQAAELLEQISRDEGLSKHLMLQAALPRVLCTLLDGPLPSSGAVENTGLPRKYRTSSDLDLEYKVKVSACAIVQRIGFHSEVFAQHLCESLVVPSLITLVRRVNSSAKVPSDRKLQHGAVLALRNLAGCHPDLQPYLSSAGLLPPLIQIISTAAEALSTHFNMISELDEPEGDLYDPPRRSVSMARAETVIPTATEAALQTCNILTRSHKYIRGQLLRSGLLPPLINILRFGPDALRLQALDICLFLMEDGEAVVGDLGRAGLISESVHILRRPPTQRMTNSAKNHLQNCRVRAALALGVLAQDSMAKSKIAALGGLQALTRFLVASSMELPMPMTTAAGADESTGESTDAVAVWAAKANTENARAGRSAALSSLRALCRHHNANYQETLRLLVLEGWMLGGSISLDEPPSSPPPTLGF